MNEEMKVAKSVFDTICRMFDSLDYHYDRHDEDLAVHCTVQGDDLPMDIVLIVHAERQLVTLPPRCRSRCRRSGGWIWRWL